MKNFVIIDKNQIQILDFNGDTVKYEITKVSKEFADAYKGDYAHYTLKEISEQPDTVLRAGENIKNAIKTVADHIKSSNNIYITGSGTSYNAALIAKQLFLKYVKIKIENNHLQRNYNFLHM